VFGGWDEFVWCYLFEQWVGLVCECFEVDDVIVG